MLNCGFANFSSIAIQIGGMAPSQQGNISRLGFRALLAVTLTTMMTAAIARGLIVIPTKLTKEQIREVNIYCQELVMQRYVLDL